jgi:hypothetical protein
LLLCWFAGGAGGRRQEGAWFFSSFPPWVSDLPKLFLLYGGLRACGRDGVPDPALVRSSLPPFPITSVKSIKRSLAPRVRFDIEAALFLPSFDFPPNPTSSVYVCTPASHPNPNRNVDPPL